MKNRRNFDELARELLGKAPSELGPEERNVLESISQRTIVAEDIAGRAEKEMSFGDRLSDRVAEVGGSWGFIIAFILVLLSWMILNTEILGRVDKAFDPYPYIFLNLILSTVAAIQAPVIMMSQNRASDKDRIAATHDYEVNLRAEIDIIRLHEKMDLLLLDKVTKLQADLDEIKSALRPADS
ncbi:MAG: DUF1003 domain-containing protein [Parasphingorhabdus sp.]|uniref:DUF1003 domain-containing protein n=1 Tax=Parasphingorhabdus sp. TaxID=2709688 RepID=UPI0030012E48